jgi:hypothetical protein
MYANKEPARVGDIVKHTVKGEGKVVRVISHGVVSGGGEDVLVEWISVYEQIPGANANPAPSQMAARSVTLVRRGDL